jgi:hypothetical protein
MQFIRPPLVVPREYDRSIEPSWTNVTYTTIPPSGTIRGANAAGGDPANSRKSRLMCAWS